MQKRLKINRLLAILALGLFLLPVAVQMAHTHPPTDRDHRDCPACLFSTIFHPTITPSFNLVLEATPSSEIVPSFHQEISLPPVYSTSAPRAPPLSF